MPVRLVFALQLTMLLAAGRIDGSEPDLWVQQNLGSLVQLYRHLHAHPELSYQEKKTSARMAEEFRQVGAEVTTGVGGYGVVGLFKNGRGPTILLRADMDALPVTEQTGLAFASTVRVRNKAGQDVGVMHACGHDVHMTNLVGTARYLSENKDRWRGTVMLIAQPAEERGGGARAMLEDGLFERFGKPDFALALHVDPTLPAGSVGCRPGFTMANVDSVDITIRGKGGHGAQPNTTIDPIVQAAQLILALQTIVSREVDPREPAVITVGAIRGGSKHNVISDTCHLQLTVRSYSDEARQHLLAAIQRKARAVAAGAGAPEPRIEVSEGTPSLRNDEELTSRVLKIFQQTFGEEKAVESEPAMVGEDFSRFGRAGVPIVMFRLGAVDGRRLSRYAELGQPPPSLHSPSFYPDVEPTLVTGITAMSRVVLDLLRPS
jgi:hippurate hydrolase